MWNQAANDYGRVSQKQHQFDDNRAFEIGCLLVCLGLLNLGLLLGNIPAENLMFKPDAVISGEYWRLLTWPWAHVSRYHLLLDGAAFLLLYSGQKEQSAWVRGSYLISTSTGSILLPLLMAPDIYNLGLCGLSGLAHGLLAIEGREMIATKAEAKLGWTVLIILLIKCSWELATGNAFLGNLHLGEIGTPIVSTHAGGALGGLLACQIRHSVCTTAIKPGQGTNTVRPGSRIGWPQSDENKRA